MSRNSAAVRAPTEAGGAADLASPLRHHPSMLHHTILSFLIRCATWALIGWLLSMNPVVTAHARRAADGWRAAWRVEAPTCGVRAYGLLFRSGDCEGEAE